MTPMEDRKLTQIPVARFSYRHEAEFAAGFLDEAGIPYRLQFDDPALGLSVGVTATLWVLGFDEARAREVLHLGRQEAVEAFADAEAWDDEAGSAVPSAERSRAAAGPLGLRERGLLLLGAGACGAGLFLPGASHPIVGAALLACGLLLAVAGIAGRAPDVLRRVLRALTGEAP